LIREPSSEGNGAIAKLALVPLLVTGFLTTILLAPGTIAEKTYAVLHGLCAQRPSHSLTLSGAALPMDARMTGIYFGALVTMVWLAAIGRWQASMAPPKQILALLLLFALATAADGTNALLSDLGVRHVYEPANELRLATGILSGISLGVLVLHVFAASVWAQPETSAAVVSRLSDLAPPLTLASILCGLAASGKGILYAPLAAGLVLAATFLLWVLTTVVISLTSGSWRRCDSAAALVPAASAAFLITLLLMAAAAGVRFMLESSHMIPKMT
jgi:uncharacterized membrane protein